MGNKKLNILAAMVERRQANAKAALKEDLLQAYELFGVSFVEDVEKECKEIYTEYIHDLPE